MKTTSLYTFAKSDFVKGLIVAIATAVFTGLTTSLNSGTLPTVADLKVIALAAGSAGIAYLTKNFLTNSEDKFMKKEPVQSPQNPD